MFLSASVHHVGSVCLDKRMPGLNYTYYEISDLHTVFRMRYTDEINGLRDYGTGVEYTMLEAHAVTLIERNPGITVTEISKTFGRSKSAISQLISRLEKKGLVNKKTNAKENLKIKGLFVTPEGQRLSNCHIEYDSIRVEYWTKKLTEEFSAEELDIAYRYMDYTIKNKIGRQEP